MLSIRYHQHLLLLVGISTPRSLALLSMLWHPHDFIYNNIQFEVPGMIKRPVDFSCFRKLFFAGTHHNYPGRVPWGREALLAFTASLNVSSKEMWNTWNSTRSPTFARVGKESPATMIKGWWNQIYLTSSSIAPSTRSLATFPFTRLDLYGNGFHREIPSSLSRCRVLQLLNLSNNLLSGPIPTQLAELNRLSSLVLSENVLTVLSLRAASETWQTCWISIWATMSLAAPFTQVLEVWQNSNLFICTTADSKAPFPRKWGTWQI